MCFVYGIVCCKFGWCGGLGVDLFVCVGFGGFLGVGYFFFGVDCDVLFVDGLEYVYVLCWKCCFVLLVVKNVWIGCWNRWFVFLIFVWVDYCDVGVGGVLFGGVGVGWFWCGVVGGYFYRVGCVYFVYWFWCGAYVGYFCCVVVVW